MAMMGSTWLSIKTREQSRSTSCRGLDLPVEDAEYPLASALVMIRPAEEEFNAFIFTCQAILTAPPPPLPSSLLRLMTLICRG
jgi:hypothetical protein